MKISAFLIFLTTLMFVGIGFGQTATPTPLNANDIERRENERRRQEQLRREDVNRRFDQMRAVVTTGNVEEIWLEKGPLGISVRYSDALLPEDSRAIYILPADITAYEDFLRTSKTGIVRLQRADVCPQKAIVVRGVDDCANGIRGKATAFSFRAGRYRDAMLADIVFDKGTLSKSGAYTIGILSDLGNVDISSLDMTSDGVQQLAGFVPPTDEVEIDRQYAVLQKGARIGSHTYAPEVSAVVGNTYVMRSVAYRAKTGKEKKGVNPLLDDERKDVTVAFKVIRKLSDGSIVMIWKELDRMDSPNIVLEARNVK